MTERHDLCRPSALISKDAELAKRIDQKMMDKESGIDLLVAEKEAENDVIQEREDALARELAAMRRKKTKLVDPIQYAFSIAAEDLANYEPTFMWEMGPATERQLDYLEKHGIYSEAVTSCGMASMLIENLRIDKLKAWRHQTNPLLRTLWSYAGMWLSTQQANDYTYRRE